MSIRPIACVLLLAISTTSLSSCASSRRKQKEKPALRAQTPAYVGTVWLVNAESQFVLIDNGLLPTPPAGLVLKSYTDGAESAELVASAVRKRPFTIADIKQGTPQRGDRVYVSPGTVLPAQATQPTSQPSAPGVTAAPQDAPDFLPQVQLSPTP